MSFNYKLKSLKNESIKMLSEIEYYDLNSLELEDLNFIKCLADFMNENDENFKAGMKFNYLYSDLMKQINLKNEFENNEKYI